MLRRHVTANELGSLKVKRTTRRLNNSAETTSES